MEDKTLGYVKLCEKLANDERFNPKAIGKITQDIYNFYINGKHGTMTPFVVAKSNEDMMYTIQKIATELKITVLFDNLKYSFEVYKENYQKQVAENPEIVIPTFGKQLVRHAAKKIYDMQSNTDKIIYIISDLEFNFAEVSDADLENFDAHLRKLQEVEKLVIPSTCDEDKNLSVNLSNVLFVYIMNMDKNEELSKKRRIENSMTYFKSALYIKKLKTPFEHEAHETISKKYTRLLDGVMDIIYVE